jgi:hypothetical protein
MSALRDLVAAELSTPVDPRVSAMAAAIAAKHDAASRAVLFYGSCLRQKQLDGLMLDFYLIVSDYPAAYGKKWLAAANRLVPPNVFYFEHGGLVSKYAVLSEADFARFCSARAPDLSVLARFAQPSRMVWKADEKAAADATSAVAMAPKVLATLTLPMLDGSSGGADLWRRAFELTYSTELRAERSGRPASIVDQLPDYYRRLGDAVFADSPELERALVVPSAGAKIWNRFRRRGKRAQVLRLAKATATFAGGVDYIAWKINRHAGTDIVIKPWQRRWPLLAAISLLPRLLRSGAVR